jgi:hypothetical protein
VHRRMDETSKITGLCNHTKWHAILPTLMGAYLQHDAHIGRHILLWTICSTWIDICRMVHWCLYLRICIAVRLSGNLVVCIVICTTLRAIINT